MEMWSRNLKRLTQHMLFAILRYGNICYCATLIFYVCRLWMKLQSDLNSQPSSIFTWLHGSYVSASRELMRNFSRVQLNISREEKLHISKQPRISFLYKQLANTKKLTLFTVPFHPWRWIERVTCERKKKMLSWFLACGDAFFFCGVVETPSVYIINAIFVYVY